MNLSSINPASELKDAEDYIFFAGNDFSATYMTVANLQFLAHNFPDHFTQRSVSALVRVLEEKKYAAQRQAFFLYKKTATALGSLVAEAGDSQLADMGANALFSILKTGTGPAFRATAEALGGLPITLNPAPEPELPDNMDGPVPEYHLHEILRHPGICELREPVRMGRSLVFFSKTPNRSLVLKTGPEKDGTGPLMAEIGWMRAIEKLADTFPALDSATESRLKIPTPADQLDTPVFRLKGRLFNCYAAAYHVPDGYFSYPNMPGPDGPMSGERLVSVLGANAFILGRLASSGLVHTAPVPLFHNRVQRHRRDDHGFYQWHRGGRIDQWLASCQFPNFGESGIRDFEHFTHVSTPDAIYKAIGTYIIGFVLTAGSYFRNLGPKSEPPKSTGKPLDVRHLFNPVLFERLITGIFSGLYRGFTGRCFSGDMPVDTATLVSRLIDVMGTDRDMEEILRVTDQNNMSHPEFESFLAARGIDAQTIATMEKGVADIPLMTGPHLGAFNGRISVPELTEFTAGAAALCVAGRHLNQSAHP